MGVFLGITKDVLVSPTLCTLDETDCCTKESLGNVIGMIS